LEGRNEATLEVTGLPRFSSYTKLKRALAKVKGVKAVNGTLHNKVARLSIECNTTAEKLAERIDAVLESSLDISDVSQNVIKAKYTGK